MSNFDQFHGQGGSFEIDPVTGERVLVDRTVNPEDAPVEAPEDTTTDAPTEAQE